MLVKISYSINDTSPHKKKTVVEGYKMGRYFAVRKVENAWEITHIPTGYLITPMRFCSPTEAEAFVMIIESTDADVWKCNSVMGLKEFIPKHIVKVLQILSKHAAETPVLSGHVLDKIIETLANG